MLRIVSILILLAFTQLNSVSAQQYVGLGMGYSYKDNQSLADAYKIGVHFRDQSLANIDGLVLSAGINWDHRTRYESTSLSYFSPEVSVGGNWYLGKIGIGVDFGAYANVIISNPGNGFYVKTGLGKEEDLTYGAHVVPHIGFVVSEKLEVILFFQRKFDLSSSFYTEYLINKPSSSNQLVKETYRINRSFLGVQFNFKINEK